MPRNYLIAIGGTGARCLEAVVYLSAAGVFQDPMHILIIDPDQNNGNSVRAKQLISEYDALHLAKQPSNAQHKRILTKSLPPPIVFQAPINRSGSADDTHKPIFWHNPNAAQRRFKEVIQYQTQKDDLKSFLSLLYEPADLEMVLDVGYRGRTNVGAVALKQDLEGTANIPNSGLRELLDSLNADLNNGEARVFVMGSVFGGTGAAGLPTIPALIDRLPDETISTQNRERLRYGCVMMTPYFSFPQGNGANGGPGTDSSRHAVATQAALLHYAHVPPGYQHVYLIGSPARPKTNDNNVAGGQSQANAPHYAEVAAALAAWDFFSLRQVGRNERELHFADTRKGQEDRINWDTLPIHRDDPLRRDRLERRLAIFTTLAYFYKNFLYERFVSERAYQEMNWYRNNFASLTLDDQVPALTQLYAFSNSYLRWLHQVGETGKQTKVQLFNWDGLLLDDLRQCSETIGNLVLTGDGNSSSPKFMGNGYNQILTRLEAIKLKQNSTSTATAMGLLMYSLHYAVAEFCKQNYSWVMNAETAKKGATA